MMHNQRGMVLGIVVISSIVFAVVAYAVLAVSSSKMQLGQFDRQRIRMRYAAESGLAIAYQRLFADPNYPQSCVEACTNCVPGQDASDNIKVDTNGDGSDDTNVLVTITTCGDGNDHVVTAKVTF